MKEEEDETGNAGWELLRQGRAGLMAELFILMCGFRSFSISNFSPQSEYLAFVSVQSRAEDEMSRGPKT